MDGRRRGTFWPLALLVCLSWAVLCVGTRPLADPDEGRYAEVSRVMLATGDWLTPQLDGRDHLSKPPITYWITATGMAVFGTNAWGARIGIGAAFGFWIFVVMAFGAVRGGSRREIGWIALVHATSLLPFVGGGLLTTDPFLSMAMGAACLFAGGALVDARRRQTMIRAFWLATALAFLIKGPPALLLVPALVLSWRLRLSPVEGERVLFRPVVVLAALLASSWYLLMVIEVPERWRVFLLEEVVDRVSSSTLKRNGPFWLPALTLVAGTLPWGALLFVPALRRRLRHFGRNPSVARSETRRSPQRFVTNRLLAAWLWGSLLVFTLSSSRMYLYVLPLSFALSVWMGEAIAAWTATRRWRRAASWATALAALSAGIYLRMHGHDLPGYRSSEPLAREIQAIRGGGEVQVVFLGVASTPGLDFALSGRLPRVAIGKSERSRQHAFDRSSLTDLVRSRGKVLAVGTMADFERTAGFLDVEGLSEVEGTHLRIGWLSLPAGVR